MAIQWEAILGGALGGIGSALSGAPPTAPPAPIKPPISKREPTLFYGGIVAVVGLTLVLGFSMLRRKAA